MRLTNLVPTLHVADISKTLEFYKDALNFEVKNTYEPEGKLIWAFLKSGNVELMLEEQTTESTQLRKDTNTSFYFYPEDVEELHVSLKTRGYPVSDKQVTFYGMKEFALEDPDGLELRFGQETSEPPTN